MKKNSMQLIAFVTMTALAVSLAGCASIVSGGPAKISVASRPDGATVTVVDNRSGAEVDVKTTPAVLSLRRGAGYFKAASYTLTIDKMGYRPAKIDLTGSVNGWYWGNFVLGGLIGMLVVDPLTGSMYSIGPKNIDRALEGIPADISSVDRKEGALIVTLLENVPSDLVGALEPVAVR